MPDNYLTATYVDNLIGNKVRTALFTDGATYKTAAFTGVCVAATAVIKNAIKTAGYTAPSTTTDEFIILATLGEFVNLAFNRPDKRIPLPQNWQGSAYMTARKAILSGESSLDLTVDTEAGHGGISITASDSSNNPQIFSRNDYADW
jgi:hypothetical protein